MTSALAAQPATPSDFWDHTHPPASDGPQIPWAGQGVHGGQWAPAGEPVPTVTSHPQCCEATPACPASRPTWPAAARSVPRPSPQPCAQCSQLLPRVLYLCVSPWPFGVQAAQPRHCPPSLSLDASQSVMVGPVYGLFICAYIGGWSTQGWG